MKVADVMTRRVRSCEATQTADVVMRILWEHDLGALPVVDELGQPLAMVTDRDVAVAAYTQGKPLHQIPVRSAMSQALVTAHVSDSLVTAERTMREHQLRRLPVVDESARLVGMLSLNDIALAQASAGPATTLRTDAAQTLAAIARPRRLSTVPAYAQDLSADDRPTMPQPAPRSTSQVRELAPPAPRAARAGGSAVRR